jgi:hypothetical protein
MASRLEDEFAAHDEPIDEEQLAAVEQGGDGANWWVTDLDAAERAMATVRQLAAQEAELADQASRWRQKVTDWLDRSAATVRRRRSYYEAQLIHYAREYRARDPKRNKTLPLLSGKVTSTEKKPVVVVADPDAFVVWAWWNRPALLKINVKPQIMEVRGAGFKIVDTFVDSGVDGEDPIPVTFVIDPETGEPIPGLGAEYPDVTFVVKPEPPDA